MNTFFQKNHLYFEICVELGACCAALGNHEKAALNFSEAMALYPHNPEPYIGLARLALEAQQWDRARMLLSRALDFNPEADEALGVSGTVFLKTGQATAAWEEFQRALTLNPANREALQGLAQAATSPEEMQEAAQRLSAHLQRHLADFPARLSLAELLARQGNIGAAREEVDKVLLFQPDHPEALALKARLEEMRGESRGNTVPPPSPHTPLPNPL